MNIQTNLSSRQVANHILPNATWLQQNLIKQHSPEIDGCKFPKHRPAMGGSYLCSSELPLSTRNFWAEFFEHVPPESPFSSNTQPKYRATMLEDWKSQNKHPRLPKTDNATLRMSNLFSQTFPAMLRSRNILGHAGSRYADDLMLNYEET